MSYPPSMVHKSGNQLVVRSVVSGNKLYGTSEFEEDGVAADSLDVVHENNYNEIPPVEGYHMEQEEELPQCKVKRNYACSSCSYYTQNPRYYLHHLKNVHKEKIRIYECPHCLYASKHSQKLQRHIHMVHVMGKRKMLIKAKTSLPKNNTNVAVKKEISNETAIDEQNANSERVISKAPSNGKQENTLLSSIAELEADRESAVEGEKHSDQPIKCSLCSFSSRNPNLVTRHERLVHLKKKFYRCAKCDYITHMKARFTKHVKYHSMPMIKCDMCDFRTPYKWNLDRHNKNHFANGAFKCSQCNFTADIKQSLTVHEMNHHVPPVNQNGSNGLSMPTPAKRRCRVGASDIISQQETTTAETDLDDLELLRMERESLPPTFAENDDIEDSSVVTSDEVDQMAAVEITMVKPNVSASGKTLNLKNPTAAAYLNGTLKPEDVILTKNGSVYVKKFKCRVCQYKAAWESEMIRHEVRVHGLDSSGAKKKSLPRPIPNLIPIQNNNSSGSSSTVASPSHNFASTSNSFPNEKSKQSMGRSAESSPLKNGNILTGGLSLNDLEYDKPLTEKDLNEIYSKSCATSSLKDFASLIGSEESPIKSDRLKDFMSKFSEEKEGRKSPEKSSAPEDTKRIVADAQPDNKKVPDAFKKKNASFFDRLKEKLMVGAGETHNLSCWCGHQSKCLSESVLHEKTHSENANEKNEKTTSSGPMISGAELSSTRCQHCRQRCKTSSDLYVHLQSCPEMIKKGKSSSDNTSSVNEKENSEVENIESNGTEHTSRNEYSEMYDEPAEQEDFAENQEADKQVNKVFVWNSFNQDKEECSDEYAEDEFRSKSPASESSLVGYEIAPGIGSVMPSSNEEAAENFKEMNIDINNVETTTKKVFKCPTCTFWASTASRFHVHVVSHMNVKPFGCSVCPYQSKWKWDVTKHIKLKKERDPTHEQAEMRTIDVETGRRNYTKYNRFLTIMRVHEPRLDLKSTAASTSSKAPSTPVPILPKLTPAPSINGDADGISTGNSIVTSSDGDVAMRPLPQLHPANPNVPVKRPRDESTEESEEPPKKKIPGEKKMWKCKKCKFRNTDRNVVLTHVKEHYSGGSGQHTMNSQNFTAKRTVNSDEMKNFNGESHSTTNGIIRCNLCNFETDNQTTFRIHNSHHVEDPSAAFKCCFCPFFANDKEFMMNHISTHGVNNAEEIVSNMLDEEDSYRKDEYDDKLENSMDDQSMGEMTDINKTESSVGDEMEIYKRFKCCNCPYVTNNKSQYLYHKQFHRLRDAPFKCNICSYNVTKRHLLHQHLKIHGVKRAQFKNCLKAAAEKSDDEESAKLNTDIDTAHLPDIPLVWVHKAGTLTKMFKCRHCPHVNLRKSNIHEHEKMHFDRIQRSPNGSISTSQASTHHCNECNYVCNNAGALASHTKVHQGAFGYICALADPRRSDESQIREITRMLKDDNRFRKDVPKTENNIEKRLTNSNSDGSPVSQLNYSNAPAPVDSPGPTNDKVNNVENKTLHFCNVCPARFLFQKDLESHTRFHSAHHMFKCNSCTYSAPMQAQLLAHKRVHSNEYQEKTNIMCQTYEISKEFDRPKTTHIADKPGFAGLGWVVIHTSQKKDETSSGLKPVKTVTKQFACHKCPAQFFKSVALQHHLTLHGGKDQYQCRGCDYRVKTYGNLIKHEAVHGLEPRMKAKMLKNKKFVYSNVGVSSLNSATSISVPTSGTELFQHRTEQMMKEQNNTPIMASPSTPASIITPTLPSATALAAAGLSADPEFGIFIHGSPDFIYPQTVKNGKLKEKRYKCHKCPSAFEKREQYKTHCTLHGAKSRFRCEKCDYSVKYFANYTQHMRKHEMNERCQSERRASIQSKSRPEELENERSMEMGNGISLMNRTSMMTDESVGELFLNSNRSPEKSLYSTPLATPTKAAKTLHISVADQQAVVLMQEKISDFGINVADQLYRCYYCPYSHQRKDAVENHERCHFNPKGSYVCEFCNYTVPQPHFIREHQKLHFGAMKGIKPEAYMKCDRLEIWMETEEGKVLIFKDSGRKENRFEPSIKVNEEDSEFKKMYVDVKTGEELNLCKTEPEFEEKVEEDSCEVLSRTTSESPSETACDSPTESLSPTSKKDEEQIEEENVEVKDEPIYEEEESKMEVDEDNDKITNGVEYDEEDVVDEEEELENVENDEDDTDIDIDASQNEIVDEYYGSGSEASEEFEDDAEVESIDQTADCDNTNLDEELTPENEKLKLPERIDPLRVVINEQEVKSEKSTKNASDESDSEDSESSSSSSSCSNSSCSSSDSSDEEKEQIADGQDRLEDSIGVDAISEQ